MPRAKRLRMLNPAQLGEIKGACTARGFLSKDEALKLFEHIAALEAAMDQCAGDEFGTEGWRVGLEAD